MKDIVLFDTSIASENGGDRIIMDYCLRALDTLNDISFFTHLPTHDYLGKVGRSKLRHADLSIVCGTNLLTSHVLSYKQWMIDLASLFSIQNIKLMGVGWWQYQDEPDLLTRSILLRILDNGHLHSVRDRYTENKLKQIGLTNVIYTSCPTMWELSKEKCLQIPKFKKDAVISTLTSYKKNIAHDTELFNILLANYKTVYVWIQSYDDYKYLDDLGFLNKVNIVGPSLKCYDKILSEGQVDYIGTRLHGGIRALNHCIRTVIISCDNRAQEISNDTGLPIIKENEISELLPKWINSEVLTDIRIPQQNIIQWKESLMKEL